MKDNIRLASGKTIGHDAPVFIIAAIGNSYAMDRMTALELLNQAANTGVDAVRMDIHDLKPVERTIADNAFNSRRSARNKVDHVQPPTKALDMADLQYILNEAQSMGLIFLAGLTSIRMPRQTVGPNFEMLKISSANLTCIPLLRQAGVTGLPVTLATGLSTLTEIDLAVNELLKFHNNIILMHSTSTCPCPPLIALQTGHPAGADGNI